MKALRDILFLSLYTSSKLSSDKNSRMRKRLTAVFAGTACWAVPTHASVYITAYTAISSCAFLLDACMGTRLLGCAGYLREQNTQAY